MGDIGVIGRIVMTQTAVLITLGVGILVFTPAAVMGARRLGWSRSRVTAAGLAGASLAIVPATTLARGEALVAWGRPCLLQPGLSFGTPEAFLNVILFAPAAFFAVLALIRATPVILTVIACSVLIEAAQSVTALGTCQTADVVRNVTGALVACVGAGLLLRASVGVRTSDEEPDLGRRF